MDILQAVYGDPGVAGFSRPCVSPKTASALARFALYPAHKVRIWRSAIIAVGEGLDRLAGGRKGFAQGSNVSSGDGLAILGQYDALNRGSREPRAGREERAGREQNNYS